MNPIRVLHVIARTNVGGPALLVAQLAERMEPAAFDVRVLRGRVDAGEADYTTLHRLELPGWDVPGLGRAVTGVGDLRALAAIRSAIRRWRPHIVHTHTAKAGVLGRLAARGLGAATIHTYHGHVLHGYFRPGMAAAVRAVEARLARSTSRLVAVGNQVRADLLAAGVGQPEQYVVQAPGVALGPLPTRAEARRALGLAKHEAVVVYAGRLAHIKRPDRLLAACAQLPRARLLVAGDGPLRSTLEADARRRGMDVRFLGWVVDMAAIYAAADVAVLTSDNEGMPVFLVEAALAGLPAVTTDVGSAAEVVVDGETGLVVAPDVDAVAGALRRLLGDGRLRGRLGAAAQRRADERFGVGRFVETTAELYREVLAER